MGKIFRYGWYIGAALLLFLLFQHQCAYDFFYTEQMRTFLFSDHYAWKVLSQPGGALEYVASFLVQFYVYDYVGPLVTAVLFFLILWLGDRWLSRLGAPALAPLGSALVGGLFIILELDHEYRTEGTLAVIACLAIACLYSLISSPKLRWALFAVYVPILYMLMGPALIALAVGICLFETSRRHWAAWALLPWAILPMVWVWYQGDCGEARLVFMPDAYYNPNLVPTMKLYNPWMVLLIASAVASLWRLFAVPFSFKKWAPLMDGIQVLVALACFGHLFQLAHGDYATQLKRLDCFRIRGEWDRILAEELNSSRNELHAFYQNLALAQKGVLADSMFHYPQCPPSGLVVEWKGSRLQSDLLSDVFWLQGNVALSQKMAFDAMYFNEHFQHPRLMLRLIETNLVLGEYGVAEKYIRLCEQSYHYADQATALRAYLPAPGEEMKEGYLTEMRRCLPEQPDAILSNYYQDLQHVLSAHSAYLPALHYLGGKFLLDNNLEMFQSFIEKVVDVKQLQPMPLHFQEALLLIYDEAKCKEYGVTDAMIARYRDFKEKIAKVKNRNDVTSIYRAGYGKTFWVHSTIYEKKTR